MARADRGRRWTAALGLCLALAAAGCGRPGGAATKAGHAAVFAKGCEGVAAQPASLEGAQSFTYATPAGRDLRIHVFQPRGRGSHPMILFFFGGGWRAGKITAFEEQARAFAAHGYVAALADYRVKCRDGSNVLDSVKDAEAAYAWMRGHAEDFGGDPSRFVLSGGSAGGHLALTTAMKAPKAEKPAAVVLFNPAVDLVSAAPMTMKLFARGVSPSMQPMADLPPVAIFHGKSDHTVPIETVRTFCARARAEKHACELHEYAGQDHAFYHSHEVDPAIGASPYDDTLEKAIAFVDRQGITKRR